MKYLSSYNLNYLKGVLSTVRILPSLRIGSKFYHSIFPRRGNLLLYITNRCNSKCLICDHWEQQPKYDLPIQLIEGLIHSKTISRNNLLVEGGEIFCHPDIDNILNLLRKEKVNYTLFTNGIMTDRLVDAVKRYKIRSVNISLDGAKETYTRTRGIDGYDKVIESINLIKDITNLQIVFTASPWNTYEDYLHVKDLCKKKNIRLMFNIYSEAAKSGILNTDRRIDERYRMNSNFPYTIFYNFWVLKLIRIPCLSSLFNVAIFPTGDVNLCVCKFIPLGNIYKNSIDEIWNSEATKTLQKVNKNCNDCWVSCYRYFDVKLALLKGQI